MFSFRSALPAGGDLAGQAALALSGKNQIAWSPGSALAPSRRWAIVVLLENGNTATVSAIAAQIRPELAP